MWKILLVDDDASSRLLFKTILEKKAFCEEAINGEEAIEAFNNSILKNTHYNLILLDIDMLGMSGIEVLETIREKEKRVDIKKEDGVPVIMITARADRDIVISACREGCNDYIIKPVQNEMVLEKVERNIKQKLND